MILRDTVTATNGPRLSGDTGVPTYIPILIDQISQISRTLQSFSIILVCLFQKKILHSCSCIGPAVSSNVATCKVRKLNRGLCDNRGTRWWNLHLRRTFPGMQVSTYVHAQMTAIIKSFCHEATPRDISHHSWLACISNTVGNRTLYMFPVLSKTNKTSYQETIANLLTQMIALCVANVPAFRNTSWQIYNRWKNIAWYQYVAVSFKQLIWTEPTRNKYQSVCQKITKKNSFRLFPVITYHDLWWYHRWW